MNVAVQDGVDAGQSVPHVHVHIIPRKSEDLKDKGGGDAIYGMMDGEPGNVGKAFMEMQQIRESRTNGKDFAQGPDAERKPRTDAEMSGEAAWLRDEMENDGLEETSDDSRD